ncbi:MAG: hypothetical protein NTX79_05915 [Candidatus Micrarchaeota archaeon]|nr:hypothetical protein [Candidatus Micrarchaeota archaeon]
MHIFRHRQPKTNALEQSVSQLAPKPKKMSFFRRRSVKLMMGMCGALAACYTICKSYDYAYLSIISTARQNEWKNNAPKMTWNDAATIKGLFSADNIEVDCTPGGSEYKICGIRPDNRPGSYDYSYDYSILHFSSFRKDRAYDIRDVNHAISGYLSTTVGQFDFCNGFLQAKIDAVYHSLALGGQSFHLTEPMKREIGQRFNGIKILETRLLWGNGFTLPRIGGYTIFLNDFYWGKEHELLHVASGLMNGKHEDSSFAATADRYAMRLISIVNRTLNRIGIPTVIGNPPPTKYEQMVRMDRGEMAFEEAMTSLVNGDMYYRPFTASLGKSLMKLAPQERKIVLDRLVLSWLNLSTGKENDESLSFFMKAFGEYSGSKFLAGRN